MRPYATALFLLLCMSPCCTAPSSPPNKHTDPVVQIPPASTSAPASKIAASLPPSSQSSTSSSAPTSKLTSAPAGVQAATPTSLTLSNKTGASAIVNVSFGSDSVINATNWPFCAATSPLVCSFTMAANEDKMMPSSGYLNATLAINGPVGCGSTKAELNLNNPAWYDVADVSLVDGYSNKISITANGTILGPPNGKEGNEKVFGLYPLGCDICTARQSPPCGIPAGGPGCHGGTQYAPVPPCQYQGPSKGGGGAVVVTALPN